ncbi:MAG TPA: CDGSH iron-sulfur domain-containing protein [Symbiobacteriaceae bacterium]|jgi:CDGSH-type Zn-finger protein
MSETTVTVRDNGPLLVSGPVVLTDSEGNKFETPEVFGLCRCGLSGKKPFCDGSHKGHFEDAPRAGKS